MNTVPDTILIGLSVALGCGLLVGIERERRMEDGSYKSYAGIRSFAVTALMGALAQTLSPALVIAGAALIILLSAISHYRDQSGDAGITTEVALFATYLLGVNSIERPDLSGALAVVLAGLLYLRESLHRFSQELLTEGELRDGLLLAAAALVVLPLLPDRPEPYLLSVNPRRLWSLMTLIMVLQAIGHVALRVGGAKLGLALSGFASGLISSTATHAAMGAQARKEPALANACLTAALLSNVATFVLFIPITLLLFPAALGTLAAPFAGGIVAAAVISTVSFLRNRKEKGDAPDNAGRAFSLVQAVTIAVVLTAATTAVAYANDRLGHPAAAVAAALAGIADAHAAAASVLSLGPGGTLAPKDMVLPILLAISTNSVSKLVSASMAGGLRFGLRAGAGLAIILAATWLPYVVLRH